MTRLQRLERQCDQLWQQAQASLWRETCGVCQDLGYAGHHIIPRRFHATRHALMNGIFLCKSCHDWVHTIKEPIWLKQSCPPLWLWHLKHKNPELVRFTEAYLLARRQELRDTIKELG